MKLENIQISSAGFQPFAGTLIDASIIVATRKKEFDDSSVLKEESTPLMKSKSLYTGLQGFKTIESLFFTCRGLRLKQANFFLRNLDSVDNVGAIPFVKKSVNIRGYVVPEDHNESALLISTQYEEPRVYNELLENIEKAKYEPEKNIPILTWFNERQETWFIHKKRPFAPILFNYYIRGRPRHLFNPSRIFADNFYGLVPKWDVDHYVLLAIMNSTFVTNEIISHARNQGNGLLKVQLFEYRNVLIPDWQLFNEDVIESLKIQGKRLSKSSVESASDILDQIDEIIQKALEEKNFDFLNEFKQCGFQLKLRT